MLIERQSDLTALCQELRGCPTLFVDTEFIGERRYYPLLCTVQLGTPTNAWIVDALQVDSLRPLGTLLAAPETLKVFHAAGQDLLLLHRATGEMVRPVFDSQVAAQLIYGTDQISFGNLVQRTVGQSLAKGHSYTAWDRRPLSAGQIEYALDDVRLLAPVYACLADELAARDRLGWAAEEFAQFDDPRLYEPRDPAEQYRRVKGFQRLHGAGLAALQALAAWREETARRRDRPVQQILRDEVLLELARHPLGSVADLHELRGLYRETIKRDGQALLQVAAAGREQPPPARESRPPLDPSLAPTVDFLALCLHALAGALDLSPTLLVTHQDLVTLVREGEAADLPLLAGWRREVAGEQLLAALRGEAIARILPDTQLVKLDWRPTTAE